MELTRETKKSARGLRCALTRLLPAALLGLAPWTPLGAAPAQQQGGLTQVVCVGTACGGSGGSGNPCTASPYCYRVKPNGSSITSLEVGVEDGDLGHYSALCGPSGWTMSIVASARSHDLPPSAHAAQTAKAGSCPYVLRFSGPAQTANFEVGYAYDQVVEGHHDASWKTSDNRQAGWTFPLGSGSGPVHSPVRPNVLLIVLDDVGTDQLTLFDDPSHVTPVELHPHAKTPHLDALAAGGVRFTNAYVNPLCSTSRACFQTGRYAFRHGIGALSTTTDHLRDCEVSLAELLKAGLPAAEAYASGAFGKWHLGSPALDLDGETHAVRNGYDRFFGTLSNVAAGGGDHFDWLKVEHDASWIDPVAYSITDRWNADVVREDAVEWITSRTRPFLAYVAFNPPHAPFTAPPLETEDQRPLVSAETATLLAGATDAPTRYRAMLEAVDSEIGYLLDDLGPRLQNTMVFVIADNGTPTEIVDPTYHDPCHGKGTPYQIGVRVPMVVSGPLASSGACAAAVGGVDLWRTIAELSGASESLALAQACSDATIDGQSLVSLIQAPGGSSAQLALSQGFAPNGVVDTQLALAALTQHGRALSDGSYKYLRRIGPGVICAVPCSPCVETEELYDLVADPEETSDLLQGTLTAPQQQAYDDLSAAMDALFNFP